jgi:hypothetical protein
VFKGLAAKAEWHDDKFMLESDSPGNLIDEAIYVPVTSIEDNADVQIRFPRGIAPRP